MGVQISVQLSELTSVYRNSFGQELDIHNYQHIAVAINRWLSAAHSGQFAGGFWNGEQGQDQFGQQVLGVVAIRQG